MKEVSEIWNYHDLFMTLKLKHPLYEIISTDWISAFIPANLILFQMSEHQSQLCWI